MAKAVRVSHLRSSCSIIFQGRIPESRRLRIAKGKAAPMENMKKGKTRSTQVRPAMEGLNS